MMFLVNKTEFGKYKHNHNYLENMSQSQKRGFFTVSSNSLIHDSRQVNS